MTCNGFKSMLLLVGVVLLVTKLSTIRTMNSVLPVDLDESSGTKLSKMGPGTMNHDLPGDSVNSANSESKSRHDNSPETSPNDRMCRSNLGCVVPECKLTFFAFPKVACTEWKLMFMRMNGDPKWRVTRDPHSPKKNKIKTLHDHPPEIATAMMTSPEWTEVAVVREPKERVLSAFLDKAVHHKHCVKHCCERLPHKNLKKQRVDNSMKFDCFLHFVTEQRRDGHWEPQIAQIDSKWWPRVDVIGHQNNLLEDLRRVLKMLHSKNRHEGEGHHQLSAWDRRGMTGWGVPGDGCENRTHAFLEENAASHKRDAGSHLFEWHAAELEKLVEEKWATEWQQERVNFPEIKLFAS